MSGPAAMMLAGGGFLSVTRTYSSAGSFTETIPPGASTAVIEATGGGGSGGLNGANAGGGGGGAGGYARTSVSVIGQGTKTIAVVVGGAAVASSVSSGTFTMPATMTANGGTNGSAAVTPTGGALGAGGTATGGNAANTTGANGVAGASSNPGPNNGGVGGAATVGINGTFGAGGHGALTLTNGGVGGVVIKYT